MGAPGICLRGVQTFIERGLPLVVLFTLLGTVAGAAAVLLESAGVRAQLAALGAGAVLWTAGCVVALNLLIDAGEYLKPTGLYDTDYSGLARTTFALLVTDAAVDVVVLLAGVGLWLPVLTGDVVAVSQLQQPGALPLAAWYVLVGQTASLLLASYLFARLALALVVVAVERASVRHALRTSWRVTSGRAHTVFLPLLLCGLGGAAALVGGIRLEPVLRQELAGFALPRLAQEIGVVAGVVVVFAAGLVFGLSLLGVAYSAVRTAAQ